MSDSLQTRFVRIRRRVRRIVCLYGLSWIVAVVFGATFVAGVLDWLLHLDDSGVRLILGLGIIAGGAWVSGRFLMAPLLVRLSDVEIALQIEQRFPGFNDSLASSVQFLAGQTDPRVGSPELQRRVIQQTMSQIERVEIADVIATRDVRRVTAVAVAICMVIAVVVGLNQVAAATALNRLMFPFAANPWPKKTELRLLTRNFEPIVYEAGSPLRMARGDALELFVENVKGSLPHDVRMQYRFAGEEIISEPLRRSTLRDDRGRPREVGVDSLVAVKGPVQFRAVGGDDHDMLWYTLDVVPPPMVKNLQVTLTPPTYSGRQAEDLLLGVGHVHALVGTRVDIRSDVNKPLRSAALRIKDNPPIPIPLSSDGTEFQTSFVIVKAGVYSYWFDLKDRQGFENSEAPRYEIRGIADLVPDIYIDKPSTDMQVTADAEIPLLLVAKDDLGLKEIHLHYRFNETEEAPGIAVPLWTGDGLPDQLAVEHVWELSELPLVQGMRIVYRAEATDDFDLGPEHIGRSVSRELAIVSPAEKLAELASRQAGLLDELERLVRTQQRAREQVGQLQMQLEKVGSLRPEDVDMLKQIALEQRQISSRLLNPVDGVESRTQQLLSELKNNRIDDPRTQRRLEQIADELTTLREDDLPTIERELTRARKAALLRPTQPAKDAHDQSAPLAVVQENQTAVLESLDEMLGLLAQWRHQRDLNGELDELISGQKTINQQTAEIGKRTLSRSPGDLSRQEQADLTKLAEKQRQQAQRLGQLRKKLGDAAEKLAEVDNSAAKTAREALHHLNRQATAGRMQEAAKRLEKNSIGQAADIQQNILDDLDDLQDILRKRAAADLETLVKKLKQAEQDLDHLKKQQEELLKKVNQAGQISTLEDREQELQRLAKHQQQLREDASHMARRLRRLQSHRAGGAARRAAARMQQAQDQLDRHAGDQAAGNQQQALDDLEQAQRELARDRRHAEEQLARELLERIADELAGMIGRQQNVIEETARLDNEHSHRGKWSRGLLKSLRNLAEVQQGLKQETERLVETLSGAEVFALALRGAARQMQIASDRLARRKTGEVTLAAEMAAKQRFVDLVHALKTEKHTGNSQAAPGGPSQDGPQTDGIPQLAQLKMLKSLQEDVNRRTAQLDAVLQRGGTLTAGQQTELEALAGEQGELADLTRNLTRRITETFETEKNLEDHGEAPAGKKSGSPPGIEFFERLLGRKSGDGKPDENPLESAVQRMRSAQKRIENRDTGKQTREIQKRIVEDLQKLIELAKQQQGRPNQSSQSPMPRPQPSPDNGKKKQTPKPEEQQADGKRRKKDGQSDRSTDKSEKGRDSKVELDRRRTLIKDYWGRLPPRLREKMLNMMSETYLPKYDELVRRYFEALAEHGRGKPGR